MLLVRDVLECHADIAPVQLISNQSGRGYEPTMVVGRIVSTIFALLSPCLASHAVAGPYPRRSAASRDYHRALCGTMTNHARATTGRAAFRLYDGSVEVLL